jgi:DNA-binding beta-propeller fold protein YncE
MPDTFNCPNCGAPLDYKGSDPIIRCPFCNSSVVVPDNLRAKPTFSSTPHNFTLSGMGDLGGLIQQAQRIKEVKELALAGKTDEAVKLYREITNTSEIGAHTAVQALSEGRPILLSNTTNFSSQFGTSVIDTNLANIVEQAVKQAQVYSRPEARINAPDKNIRNKVGCLLGGSLLAVFGMLALLLVPTVGPLVISSFSSNTPNAIATMQEIIAPVLEYTATPEPSPTPGFGNIVMSFGGEGTGPGLFTDERSIAVDVNSGNIYVAEYEGGRVQAFDANGKFITQWMVGDKETTITGMTADRKGNIFVVAGGKILRYNGDGKLQATISGSGKHYEKVIAGVDGNLTAISNGEDVVRLTVAGKTLSSIPAAISTISGDSELDSIVTVDGQGDIFILATFNDSVFKFGPDGKYIDRFGSSGDKPGQFTGVDTIAVDGQGRIYVSDVKGIQVFDSDGRYLDLIDIEGAVFGMVFDDQNNLYAASNVNKVFKFSISK